MKKKIFLSLVFFLMTASAFAQKDGTNEQFVTKYIDGIVTVGQIIGYAIIAYRGVTIGVKLMTLGTDERSGDEGKKITKEVVFIIAGGIVLFGLKQIILFIQGLVQ